MEQRVLIYAPVGKDARHVCQVLARADIECFVCSLTSEILDEIANGVGMLLLVEEALSVDFLKSISGILKQQQTWSDLPILVLSKRGLDSPGMRDIYGRLGNVTLMERPIQGVTLLAAVNAALRARKRQYEMREVDRRKDEFLAMLAHELRNPLAPISAAAELLRFANLDPERISQTSEIISRQVDHMSALIDDLLDMSRVSRGLVQLDHKVLDARHIVANAVEQVRPLIDSRGHLLSVHTPPESGSVKGDQKRLIQVLSNLLNNAAKYTPEGGNISLTLDVDDKNVTVSVTDDGIGLAPNVIGHVFEMFTQAERTPDRAQGGLGIGLALVKNLVELHQGAVSAYSAGTGCGSTFSICLPRADTLEEALLHATDNAEFLLPKRRRLLLVDDNRDAARMLGMYLESAGHEIIIEHSARDALERARTAVPDICLLDIGLPDMDGNELAQQLRASPETTHSILIAITGYGQEQDRKKTTDAGFNHHFVKPVNMKQLLAILAEPDVVD
jgi:signal transduction histidine kinase/CheY-like chemotaxis protein